jgi:SAM-dependent methyltransferase
MGSSSSPYDRQFFDERTAGSLRSASRILPRVLELIPAQSGLDVGCGVGTWVKAMLDLGVKDCIGVDGDYVAADDLLMSSNQFRSMDLKNPTPLNKRFDLVMSLEVAEHLPIEVAEPFVHFLISHGDVILFSAATPLQGGTDHRNEQWPSYWAKLFAQHGYFAIDCLRLSFFNDDQVDWWYAQNMILYVSKGARQRYPGLRDLPAVEPAGLASLVHPRLLERWAQQVTDRLSSASFRELMHVLPHAFKKSLDHRLRNIVSR